MKQQNRYGETQMNIHRVKDGESIRDIAVGYEMSPLTVAEQNGCSVKESLCENEQLIVLKPTRTATVKRSEPLGRVAERFSVSEDYIIAYNPGLEGTKDVYEGQTLGVKFSPALSGNILTNGYYYKGCPKESLCSALPYISTVTVCAVKIHNGEPIKLLNENHLLERLKGCGIPAIMRIYLGTAYRSERFFDMITSVYPIAKQLGYAGICLSPLRLIDGDTANIKDMLGEIKTLLNANGLALVTESEMPEVIAPSDISVCSYDKIHLDDIPTFEEGERAVYTRLANENEPSGIIIDLSPFAFKKDKYLGKKDALNFIRRRKIPLTEDKERGILIAQDRAKPSPSLIMESLENLKAKLGLISELGFLGVSFDISRAPINELLMLRAVFNTVKVDTLIRHNRFS